MRDRWTAEEYREYQRTGRMPDDNPFAIPLTKRAREVLEASQKPRPSREEVEEAWKKAEREGRVMVLDIPADRGGACPMNENRNPPPPQAPKKPKYGNEKITEDGITFDSKHEYNVYCWLKARKERGELRWVFVHMPFRFTCGVTYWADFLTILPDGTVEAVWDAKSEITAKNKDYVMKKKLLLSEWGVHVREVMREDSDGNGGFDNPKWV